MRLVRMGIALATSIVFGNMMAEAVLLDKILAVVNGEVLTLQDFEDHLALRRLFQPTAPEVDRQQALQRFVDHTLLRQEAVRTRIVEVTEAEIAQYIRAVEAQADGSARLAMLMQDRGITRRQVQTWVRHQLMVGTFIDRRIRLFVRVSEEQIAQYYRQHQQAIGEAWSKAVGEQIRQLLVEQQVNARLDGLIDDLRRKATLDFPP